jgi:non-homologous end joining protein Ku
MKAMTEKATKLDAHEGDPWYDPKKFEDQYEDSMKELLKRRQHGEKIEVPTQREPEKVVNLLRIGPFG